MNLLVRKKDKLIIYRRKPSYLKVKDVTKIAREYVSKSPLMKLTSSWRGAYPTRSLTVVRQRGEFN